MTNSDRINWFWAHRRNASLHHFSFLMQGLSGKGWAPVVDFWFDNQIVIGVPGKGCYVFYDKDQLAPGAKFKDIQGSIDKNPNFVSDFKRRTDELFGAIFFKCLNIDSENLALLSETELADIYADFIRTIMAAPIVTVQVWGIEACLDQNYKILKFLETKLDELGKGRDFEMYKGLLSVNTGETVAFTEQKNFYQVASKLHSDETVRALFGAESPDSLVSLVTEHPEHAQLVDKHIEKYEWINTEYVSNGWTKARWMELFKKALEDSVTPKEKLNELLSNFQSLNAEREKAIRELNPPPDVLHALSGLAELIAERDWTKGYMTRAFLSYHRLLDEIAKRLNTSRSTLFSYSYLELETALRTSSPLPAALLAERAEHGFAIVIKHGVLDVITGKEQIRAIIDAEGISEPFDKVINVSEFKGTPASRGHISGKARVIEDASMISKLEQGEILVTYMTTIEFIPAFRKASAVVTDEGGMSCHAAIISREFKLPCIVGTKIATRVIQTGDMLDVDATTGIIKILSRAKTV